MENPTTQFVIASLNQAFINAHRKELRTFVTQCRRRGAQSALKATKAGRRRARKDLLSESIVEWINLDEIWSQAIDALLRNPLFATMGPSRRSTPTGAPVARAAMDHSESS